MSHIQPVIPAQAGIHQLQNLYNKLDTRLRGYDERCKPLPKRESSLSFYLFNIGEGVTMKLRLILVGCLLASCSSTGVVPMDSGTYMISKRSAQVGFGPPDGTKADVYIEANEYCSEQSKSVQTIKLDMTDSGFAKPGNVSLTFRCK